MPKTKRTYQNLRAERPYYLPPQSEWSALPISLRRSIVPNSEEFRRDMIEITPYLFRSGSLRYQRMPNGGGFYYSRKRIVAVETADAGYLNHETETMTTAEIMSQLRFIPPHYIPVSNRRLVEIKSNLDSLSTTLRRYSIPELIARFGSVPVTFADSWAAGNCTGGTRGWMEKNFGDYPYPTVAATLTTLGTPDAIRAAISSIAFAYGPERSRAREIVDEGLTICEVVAAIRRGYKAAPDNWFETQGLE